MAVTFVNLTDSPVTLKVTGVTKLTISADGRLPYYKTAERTTTLSYVGTDTTTYTVANSDYLDGIVLAKVVTGAITEISELPDLVADKYYIVTQAMAMAIGRSDFGWIDNSGTTSLYITGA